MKRRNSMKRIALISIIILSIAVAAAAQRGPGFGPPPPPPGQGADDPLATYLQLTSDQKAAWEAARKEAGDAMKPLFEKQRDLREQIEKATDACSIGALVLQERANGDQLKAAHEALDQKL